MGPLSSFDNICSEILNFGYPWVPSDWPAFLRHSWHVCKLVLQRDSLCSEDYLIFMLGAGLQVLFPNIKDLGCELDDIAFSCIHVFLRPRLQRIQLP